MTRRPTAHIQIVGWNHRAYLPSCLRPCLAQTYAVPVLYVDNASEDGSALFVRETFPSVRVLQNATNRGYAGGHNDGLRAIPETDIAILLNPDVVPRGNFVEECLKGFADTRVAAVAPLLLRGQDSSRDSIDAYGDILLPSLRAVNQYQGLVVSDVPALSFSSPVWGFTGAAVALRRSALLAVALDGEVFDEDMFAYREDVDLSWRLGQRGWKIVGMPTAKATHVRLAKRGHPKFPLVAQLSWRNYFLVLAKNAPSRVLLAHVLPVLGESLARVLFLLVTPPLWPAATELVRLWPRFMRKRARVFGARSGSRR